MAKTRPQYLLVDLVAVIVICGLGVALMRSFAQHDTTNSAGIFLLIGLVAVVWTIFTAMRTASTFAAVRAAIHRDENEGLAPDLPAMRSSTAPTRLVAKNSGPRRTGRSERRVRFAGA